MISLNNLQSSTLQTIIVFHETYDLCCFFRIVNQFPSFHDFYHERSVIDLFVLRYGQIIPAQDIFCTRKWSKQGLVGSVYSSR